MNFKEIAENRQSCRAYDAARGVEEEKLGAILESARLSPSACNGQPYHITVCRGEAAKQTALAVQGMGMNKFASDAPVMLVISEKPYVASAALGAKLKTESGAIVLSPEPAASALLSGCFPRKPGSPVLPPHGNSGRCQTSPSAAY